MVETNLLVTRTTDEKEVREREQKHYGETGRETGRGNRQDDGEKPIQEKYQETKTNEERRKEEDGDEKDEVERSYADEI